MKLCNLCHWLLQRKRWPVYALALLALVITLFSGPVWLFLLVLSAIVMAAALCAIYLRDLHGLWRGCHLRRPAPRDGQAEIVMVDAALLDHGPMLLCAAQPAIPQLELKKEEGPLLLGRAMLLLTGALPKQDAAALTNAMVPPRFEINFLSETGDIAFHIKPRFSSATMVANTFQGGRWGQEEVSSVFPLVLGEPFEVRGRGEPLGGGGIRGAGGGGPSGGAGRWGAPDPLH